MKSIKKTLLSLLLSLMICVPCYGAVYLSGDADYINVGDRDITGAITIAAWINPTDITTAGFGSILNKREGNTVNYAFEKDNTAGSVSCGKDQLRFYFYDTGYHIWCTTDANLSAGTWYHVAVTYDQTNDAIFYVNGVQKTASRKLGTASGTLTANNIPALIGWFSVGSCNRTTNLDCPFIGKINDLFIKNAVLTQPQIQQLYDSKIKNLFYQYSPSSCWSLDNGADGAALTTTASFYRDSCGTYHGTGVDADGDSLNKAEEVLSYP